MFKLARLKLTAWYLLIIMLVSMVFSFAIYNGINREFGRFESAQELRLERERSTLLPLQSRGSRIFDPLMISQAREHLTLTLILLNLGILVISGFAGYFLAGKTLKPIKEMVDEQNRFITDSSHELRTPLTSLKTTIEVALRDKNLNLYSAKKLLKSNLEDVDSLQILSDDLIKLAQSQNPNGNFVFENVSVAEILSAAIDKIKPLAGKNKISIKTHIKNLEIEGDKKSLTETLVILLDNAVKYSNKNSSVEISSGKDDGHFMISVSDKGIGIESKDLPFIFDRFYRVEKSRSKDVAGYGLGLSIAKKIISVHNGSISVKSKKGKGTTFTIKLPVKHSRLA